MSEQVSPKRGEVYMHTPTGKRVVVLSGDTFNADTYTGRILVAPFGRRPSPVSVPCGEQDPVAGHVHIAKLSQATVSSLADCACTLSGHTIDRLNRALVTLFDLPY